MENATTKTLKDYKQQGKARAADYLSRKRGQRRSAQGNRFRTEAEDPRLEERSACSGKEGAEGPEEGLQGL